MCMWTTRGDKIYLPTAADSEKPAHDAVGFWEVNLAVNGQPGHAYFYGTEPVETTTAIPQDPGLGEKVRGGTTDDDGNFIAPV